MIKIEFSKEGIDSTHSALKLKIFKLGKEHHTSFELSYESHLEDIIVGSVPKLELELNQLLKNNPLNESILSLLPPKFFQELYKDTFPEKFL